MQKNNKFLSIFLCLVLIMSIIPMGYISASAETTLSFSGDGSIGTPYLIKDEDDLIELADYVNADTDNDCAGLFFKQTADIEVTADFEPIGCGDSANDNYYYFNGTYDGDRYEINGSIGTEDERRQALFGGVGGNGTIKNVTNNANVTGDVFVGGVVGENYGTIENCKNNGVITGTGYYVGGVVGYNCSYDDITGTITNCYNTGAVTGTYNYIGGVVGNNYGGEITNCYNTGNVIGKSFLGGVVGNNDGTIANCYNSGSITGTDHIGGVVGNNYGGTIANCYNIGDITGIDMYIGGVVGYNDGEITNCYNAGMVKDNSCVGGVVGFNNGTITNCYNTGDVEGQNDGGGAVGYNEGIIENSYYDSDKCLATDDEAIGKDTAYMSTQEFVDNLNNGKSEKPFEYCEGNFAYNYYPYLDVFGASSAQIASAKEQTNFSKGDGTKANPFLIENLDDLKKLAEIVNAGDDCTNLFFKQTADIEVTNFVPIGCYGEGYGDRCFNGTYDGDNKEINGTIGADDKDCQAPFGVVGSNGTIKNIINNADVKGYMSASGVVAENRGKIENCQNNGAVTGAGAYVGGIVGYNDGGTITNCHNEGTIKGTDDYVGGVVGDNYGTITNCHNEGTVTGTGYYVGGVVGDNYGTITNCFNTGAVTGKEDVGGVVGYNDYYNVESVSYIGTITNCYNTGDVNGYNYVGGVLGYNDGGTITNCYNIGAVKGTGSVIGGVAGVNEDGAIITSCYFNKDVFVSEDTAGKTTDEMSTQDFVDLLNGEGTAFSFKDDEDYLYYPYLTVFGEDSAVVSKEKVEYEVTQGDNQKVKIGTDGTLSFTSEGEFGKFKALYLGDEIKKENLVAATNYKAVSGSTKITLNADYVKTLPLGKQTFTLEFVDGYSTVNLEVTKGTPDYTIPTNLTATYGDTLADVTLPNGFTFDDVATTPVGNVGNNIFKVTFTPDDEVNYNKVKNLEVTIKVEKAEDDKKPVVDDKPTTDDKNPTADDTENPKTDANSNFVFISILALISVAGAYGVKKKLSK